MTCLGDPRDLTDEQRRQLAEEFEQSWPAMIAWHGQLTALLAQSFRVPPHMLEEQE